ncbi:MAG TPA: LPXTG cell wall anchor domain-containing protein [Acidimicrobiales bacterium]|nr:LPXTG cell wall anchor domain-containing protein [Acidimicrobiales bacterium]
MQRRITTSLLGAGIVLIGVGALPSAAAEADWYVEATPSSAAVGDQITIRGELECPGMDPGGDVYVMVYADHPDLLLQTTLGHGPLQADDTFELTVTVPATLADVIERTEVATPPGDYLLEAFCSYSDTEPNKIRGPFTIVEGGGPPTSAPTTSTPATTSTTAAPPTSDPVRPPFSPPPSPPTDPAPFTSGPSGPVAAGATITIDEGGFLPGEDVHVVLYSTPTVLATLTADATGAVRGEVTIPADTAAGRHTLVLYGGASVKARALEVSAAPGQAAAPTQTLPRTGTAATTWLAVLGMALVTSGLALVRRERVQAAIERRAGT